MSAPTALIQSYQIETPTTVTIYALRDPRTREVRYVGKAVDPRRRLQQHLSAFQLSYYRSQKVSWLKNLLDAGEQPILDVLQIVEAADANRAERQWIAQYRAEGARLTNGTDGGDGGAVTDPEAKARIRAAHVGRKTSDKTKKKMSVAHKALITPEERERLRSISNGKPPVHHGEKNPRTKLSDAQVRELREQAAAGAVLGVLAAEYGITRASVTQIVCGQTRAAAGGPTRAPRSRRNTGSPQELERQVERVRQLYGERPAQALITRLAESKSVPIEADQGGF
jgi:GIY-YIG catalytic domain